MPNVPNILTVESLKEKYAIASKKSLANYSSSWGMETILMKL
jgi:dihydroorotase